MQALKSNIASLDKLVDMGSHPSMITPECMEACKLLISLFYGESSSDLNAIRYRLFTKKNVDSTKLPPTDDAAALHIKRANHQCYIWKNARNAMLRLPSPVGNGWKRSVSGTLEPELMTRPPALETITELVVCGCVKGCERRCSCKAAAFPYTPACKCDGVCKNMDCDCDDTDEIY